MRRIKKFYEKWTSSEHVRFHYGDEVIDDFDNLISDIKDILQELEDQRFYCTVGYTPLTLTYREKSPKVVVSIVSNINKLNRDYFETIERLRNYVNLSGFIYGDNSWDENMIVGQDVKKTYQMIISK